jgi:hypothetical protein
MKLKRLVPAMLVTWLIIACNNADKQDTVKTGDTVKTTVTDANTQTTVSNGIKSDQVPGPGRSHFEAKYPQASQVVWSRYRAEEPLSYEWDWYGWPTLDTNDYAVRFNMNDNPYWVWYDETGNWIGSLETVPVSGVPEAVNKTLKSEFSGYTVQSVKRENDKNRVAYEIELDKGDDKLKLLVDETGKVMKKKSRSADTKTKDKNI